MLIIIIFDYSTSSLHSCRGKLYTSFLFKFGMKWKTNNRLVLMIIIIIIIIIIKKFKKINNYSELGVEIARVLNLLREVVPVVIGALGSIPKNLHRHLESLGIKVHVSMMQKSALLGTANIQWKVLLSEVIDLIDRTLYVKGSSTN